MTIDFERRHLLAGTGALAAATLLPGLSQANTRWPERPVTLIVPFPVGGGTDAFARPLCATWTKTTGDVWVIDNRGGAGGTLGATVASQAAPDGHTLFMGAVHHAIAPAMYKRLDYDIERSFIPIGQISRVPQVIVVNPARVPVRTLPELIEFMRKNPGKLNYGSAGNGTSHHLAGELFKLQTKTFITHIPYRGSGVALQDLVGGQIDLMFDGIGSSAPHIRSGRIRALAVATDKRLPGFPDLPTTAEAGLPSYQVATWYGLWAPKGTSPEIVQQAEARLRRILESDEIRASWSAIGAEVPALYGNDFGRFVSSEIKRWAEVVRVSGVKLE